MERLHKACQQGSRGRPAGTYVNLILQLFLVHYPAYACSAVADWYSYKRRLCRAEGQGLLGLGSCRRRSSLQRHGDAACTPIAAAVESHSTSAAAADGADTGTGHLLARNGEAGCLHGKAGMEKRK